MICKTFEKVVSFSSEKNAWVLRLIIHTNRAAFIYEEGKTMGAGGQSHFEYARQLLMAVLNFSP